MIKIDLLKKHPNAISALANIWHEVLGKIWVPDVLVERVIARFADHLNDQALPITFIALDGDLPVGMCSLRENDAIRPDLTPWLGSLVVDPKYQKQGIGKMLVDEWYLRAGIGTKSIEFVEDFVRTVAVSYTHLTLPTNSRV